MSRSFRPYPSDGLCPCDSGLVYGSCCQSKSFKVGLDDEGRIIKRVQIPEAVSLGLESVQESFSILYGRQAADDDLIFGHVSDPTESVFSSARDLMDAGLDPALVYAYVQTDGLLPTEFNLDKIADADLELFNNFVDEYREPGNLDNGYLPAFVFVTLGNEIISSRLQTAESRLRMVITEFLSRHISDAQRTERMYPSQSSVSEFSVQTPLDYALFSALKTKRTLESMEKLAGLRAQESVYALARSVYENTVYLDAIAGDETFFWKSISPKVDEVNYTFGRHNDGRINYNHVISRDTGKRAKTNLQFRKIAQDPARAEYTRELYSLFYVTACQFVHVDVLSARAYFHDADPFDELDPDLLARLVVFVLIGDFIRALIRIEGVSTKFTSDAKYFLTSLSTGLEEALQYANSDPDHTNDVFDVLITVTSGW